MMIFYVMEDWKELMSMLLCRLMLVFVSVKIGMMMSVVGMCKILCMCLFIEIFFVKF